MATMYRNTWELENSLERSLQSHCSQWCLPKERGGSWFTIPMENCQGAVGVTHKSPGIYQPCVGFMSERMNFTSVWPGSVPSTHKTVLLLPAASSRLG